MADMAALRDTAVHGSHWRLRREHPAHQQVRRDAGEDAVTRARVTFTASEPDEEVFQR